MRRLCIGKMQQQHNNTLKANPDDNTLKANPALCKLWFVGFKDSKNPILKRSGLLSLNLTKI